MLFPDKSYRHTAPIASLSHSRPSRDPPPQLSTKINSFQGSGVQGPYNYDLHTLFKLSLNLPQRVPYDFNQLDCLRFPRYPSCACFSEPWLWSVFYDGCCRCLFSCYPKMLSVGGLKHKHQFLTVLGVWFISSRLLAVSSHGWYLDRVSWEARSLIAWECPKFLV